MLIDGLITLLKTDATVIAVNGTDPTTPDVPGSAVFENELPRAYTFPALVIHVYGGNQEYDMAGPDSLSECQVQLDSYGGDSASCRALATAARILLKSYVGTLPDGTFVPGLFQERDMAMPYVDKANQKNLANRWMTGFRVVSNQM